MRLLLFGQLRDVAEHLNGAVVPLASGAVRDVVEWTRNESEALFAALHRPGVRFAVDQHFVDLDARVHADSEVAFMSPLSGG
jgi:molybdopterin converting factor small subunit